MGFATEAMELVLDGNLADRNATKSLPLWELKDDDLCPRYLGQSQIDSCDIY